jgi:23S rRNA (cytidine1920-2'-O)/16S rRNA (cytidine1409-2'-O)-methyltransferase
MREKKRLDLLVADQRTDLSRNQIQSFILQRKVKVNDLIVDKAGTQIYSDANIELDVEQPKYVSRGGFKLEAALDHFKIDVKDLVAMDSGISTGGFTDCLLQRGIKRVYGIDVGLGQVHERVRQDLRLILYEKTNLRLLEALPELVDLVTLDLSFISILKVMPAVLKLIKPNGRIVALIKPQFEAERGDIRRGGVVKDESVHLRVIQKIKNGMREFGFECVGVIDSPIVGATSGNKEFLGLFERIL